MEDPIPLSPFAAINQSTSGVKLSSPTNLLEKDSALLQLKSVTQSAALLTPSNSKFPDLGLTRNNTEVCRRNH